MGEHYRTLLEHRIQSYKDRINSYERELHRNPVGRDALTAAVERLLGQVEDCEQQLATHRDQLESERNERRLSLSADQRNKERENADFWFRRAFTAIGVANAAAFVALGSGLIQSSDRATLAPLIVHSMEFFTAGMIGAGIVPLMLWLRSTFAEDAHQQDWFAHESETLSNGAVVGHIERRDKSVARSSALHALALAIAAIAAMMFFLGAGAAIGTMHAIGKDNTTSVFSLRTWLPARAETAPILKPS